MQLTEIERRIREAAAAAGMSIDREVYRAAGRDPLEPIVFAGSLEAPVAFFARDLGKDEVALGEPLIGGAGRRVRRAVHRFLFDTEPPTGDKYLRQALEHILLTNTVPYKPVGNKAYPAGVRERFRPMIASFLLDCWSGDYVITLGTEAFMWFSRYAEPGAFDSFWKRPDRYESEIICQLSVADSPGQSRRSLTIAPLPHPSPLNRTYLELFPEMLNHRLRQSPLPGK